MWWFQTWLDQGIFNASAASAAAIRIPKVDRVSLDLLLKRLGWSQARKPRKPRPNRKSWRLQPVFAMERFTMKNELVGALEHGCYFSIQLGIMIPTGELIFFRGVGQPPTR